MRQTLFSILSFSLILLQEACADSPKTIAKAVPVADTVMKIVKDTVVFEAPAFTYHFEKKEIWKSKDSFAGNDFKHLIAGINRTDVRHLYRLDSFLVPDRYIDSISYYMPFPLKAEALNEIKKIIIFSYPTQSFAAYDYGVLALSGPTSMGKKTTKTPTGLFFCNWKAKEIRSTVDNEWILKWNFNVSNFGGIGFHQYDLPGYPASHSCMRLWAEQAEFLYYWAEQWKLSGGKQMATGTAVIIDGEYPFGQPRPWFVLAKDGKALDISNEQIAEMIAPFKEKIIEAQQSRESLYPTLSDSNSVVQ